MMEKLHRRAHLVGTDLFCQSSSSSTAVRLDLNYAHHEPLLLRHNITWKHLQEPADSARLEEFNSAVRRSDCMASAAAHGGEGKRKTGKSIQVIPAAPENIGQVASEGVPAGRSVNVVDADGRKAAGIGADRPLTVRSARPGEFDDTFRSDHMASVADVGGGGLEKKATSVRFIFSSKARDAAKRQERVRPERRESRAGEEAASASARSNLNGASRSPSRSATAPPPDDIFREGSRTNPAIEANLQVPAPASGKVCAGNQHAGPSSPNPLGKRSPPSDTKPAADDASGVVNLYDLGLAAATAMDDEDILSEVAMYVGVEANQGKRPQRRAVRQRKAAAAAAKVAAPVHFALRLSDEEVMEDVAAVSIPKDVNAEAKAPVVYLNGKRRRG